MKNPAKVPVKFVILAIVALLGVCSCGGSTDGKRFVDNVGSERLISYFSKLDATPVDSSWNGEIPRSQWLEAFSESGVKSIHKYMKGFLVVLSVSGQHESGVYVTTESLFRPEDGSGISFQYLSKNIYVFEQKVRTPAR